MISPCLPSRRIRSWRLKPWKTFELRDHFAEPVEERILGTTDTEDEAIELARAAREAFMESGRHDYAWWVVRQPGMTLARWIADSSSSRELVLDLHSGELVEH